MRNDHGHQFYTFYTAAEIQEPPSPARIFGSPLHHRILAEEGLGQIDLRWQGRKRPLRAKQHLICGSIKRISYSQELANAIYAEYYRTCSLIVGAFGKTRLVDEVDADDFESLRN